MAQYIEPSTMLRQLAAETNCIVAAHRQRPNRPVRASPPRSAFKRALEHLRVD